MRAAACLHASCDIALDSRESDGIRRIDAELLFSLHPGVEGLYLLGFIAKKAFLNDFELD